jgi:hypothetical protein
MIVGHGCGEGCHGGGKTLLVFFVEALQKCTTKDLLF